MSIGMEHLDVQERKAWTLRDTKPNKTNPPSIGLNRQILPLHSDQEVASLRKLFFRLVTVQGFGIEKFRA